MSKFLIMHPLPSPMEIAQVEPVARIAKRLSGADAYWVSSWLQLDDHGKATRICCEWDAKDLASIDQLMKKMRLEIPGFPIDGPYPMMKADGESYR